MTETQAPTQNPPKLLDQVHSKFRLRRYSKRTEELYIRYIKDYIKFHGMRHPSELNEKDIESYLTHLAVTERVSATTQNLAFNALLFLYRQVLGISLTEKINALRAFRPSRLPVVLSKTEINGLLKSLEGTEKLIVELLYGTGLRVSELVNLRIKDIDFDLKRIKVVGGKGNKDRFTLLPAPVAERLRGHISKVAELHTQDLKRGYGTAYLPNKLATKYRHMGKERIWQFVFPSTKLFRDPVTGNEGRWHLDTTTISRIVRKAALRCRIPKRVTPHTLRHTFATHLMQLGVNLRIIQELMGHHSPETTMIYTRVMENDLQVKSPLEVYGS